MKWNFVTFPTFIQGGFSFVCFVIVVWCFVVLVDIKEFSSHRLFSFEHGGQVHRFLKHRTCLLNHHHDVCETNALRKDMEQSTLFDPNSFVTPVINTHIWSAHLLCGKFWYLCESLRGMLPEAHTTEVSMKSLLYSQDLLTDVRVAILIFSTLQCMSHSGNFVTCSFSIHLLISETRCSCDVSQAGLNSTVLLPSPELEDYRCACHTSLLLTRFAISSWYDRCIRVDKALPGAHANMFCLTEVFIEVN